MTAQSLLAVARSRGITVAVEGGDLIVEGDFDDALLASFKAHKRDVIVALTGEEAMGLTCDDCGRPTPVALVTDYGARYCRQCVRARSLADGLGAHVRRHCHRGTQFRLTSSPRTLNP